MRLKEGVVSRGLSNEILLAIMVANEVYAEMRVDLVITSLADGEHSEKSKHHRGDAVDIRTRNLPGGSRGDTAKRVSDEIRARLGVHYDVVLESTHIHIEYDPRRPS